MINSFKLMYLLAQMLEYQQKAACISSFMGLQEDVLGITQQLTSVT